jgi:hypothetical protein
VGLGVNIVVEEEKEEELGKLWLVSRLSGVVS